METQVVTGAFGYTGKYITQRLLNKNIKVKTLTNSIHRKNDFGNKVMVSPFTSNLGVQAVEPRLQPHSLNQPEHCSRDGRTTVGYVCPLDR
jgi:hypothetical protein